MRWLLVIGGLAVVAWVILRRQAQAATPVIVAGPSPEEIAMAQAAHDTAMRRAGLQPDQNSIETREDYISKFSTVPKTVDQSQSVIWKPGKVAPAVASNNISGGWKITAASGPSDTTRSGRGHF